MATVWVELLFPLMDPDDPATLAVFVDGLSNQGYGQGTGSGDFAPQKPHQIATDQYIEPE